MDGVRILEAGSGAGRFTEVLLRTGADVYSFDYSSAVDANYANNGGAENLSLFQGNIFNIPFAERSFEKVFCLGVIQHTPDPELAFKSLARQVKPGGELVIDVYTKRLVSLLHWKYFLRPITTRMDKKQLYRFICSVVPLLLPITIALRKAGGRFGAKLSPIEIFPILLFRMTFINSGQFWILLIGMHRLMIIRNQLHQLGVGIVWLDLWM